MNFSNVVVVLQLYESFFFVLDSFNNLFHILISSVLGNLKGIRLTKSSVPTLRLTRINAPFISLSQKNGFMFLQSTFFYLYGQLNEGKPSRSHQFSLMPLHLFVGLAAGISPASVTLWDMHYWNFN